MFAAQAIFFDGQYGNIHCPILTHGVSEDNIKWLEELDDTDIETQSVLNDLGMAFWQYDDEMRATLLKRLRCFDPFSNCPIGGLMPHETEDSLYAVAIQRPASYLKNWGKFRNIGCNCVTAEVQTDVCSGGRSTHPHTAVALRVLNRIRNECPAVVKIADMVPRTNAFF